MSAAVVSSSRPDAPTAHRVAAAVTVLVMAACVVPAIAIPIAHGALLGLFSPDLGAGVVFSLIGAFLLVRGPVVSIAVILCVQGLGASSTAVLGVLVTQASDAGPLHGAMIWLTWASLFLWLPGVLLLVPLVLLFPDGTLWSPKWRWLIRANGALAGIFVIEGVLRRVGMVDGKPESYAPNPTGVIALHGTVAHVADAFNGAVVLGFMGTLFVSLGAVIGRRRAVHGVERAQLTCLLLGALGTVIVISGLIYVPWNAVAFAVGLVAVAPVAFGISIAVLRFRLYEIDRVVSRTVTYALVVVVLAGVYLGVVSLLAAAVPTGFGHAGVAAATLAVTVLAAPLARRIRRGVDRRFNRRRFDAHRLVEDYADQVRRPSADASSETLAAGLAGVAMRVVEPAHASVWLAPSGK